MHRIPTGSYLLIAILALLVVRSPGQEVQREGAELAVTSEKRPLPPGVVASRSRPGPSEDELRKQYEQWEDKAAQLARKYRNLPADELETTSATAAFKLQLTRMVNEAFNARQQLQRAELERLRERLTRLEQQVAARESIRETAELERLRERLTRLEQQVAARESIREAIVRRRAEDLLNPNRKWEPSELAARRERMNGSKGHGDPDVAAIAAEEPIDVEGVITAVSGNGGFVEISIGSDDAVHEGAVLHVFREDRYVGRIKVIKTSSDRAAAEIIPEYPKSAPLKGDRVSTKPEPARREIDVEGVITAVSGSGRLVEISIGSDAAVHEGAVLHVFREDRYVGRIKVIKTSSDRAAAEIIPEYRKSAPLKGDRVSTKPEPACREPQLQAS